MPNIKSNQVQKANSNGLDSIEELVAKEFDKLRMKDHKPPEG